MWLAQHAMTRLNAARVQAKCNEGHVHLPTRARSLKRTVGFVQPAAVQHTGSAAKTPTLHCVSNGLQTLTRIRQHWMDVQAKLTQHPWDHPSKAIQMLSSADNGQPMITDMRCAHRWQSPHHKDCRRCCPQTVQPSCPRMACSCRRPSRQPRRTSCQSGRARRWQGWCSRPCRRRQCTLQAQKQAAQHWRCERGCVQEEGCFCAESLAAAGIVCAWMHAARCWHRRHAARTCCRAAAQVLTALAGVRVGRRVGGASRARVCGGRLLAVHGARWARAAAIVDKDAGGDALEHREVGLEASLHTAASRITHAGVHVR